MNLLDILYPVCCPICHRVLRRGEDGVCVPCRKRLPYVTEPCCKHCGKPLVRAETAYCRDCAGRMDQSALDCGTAVWLYDTTMKQAVADFKYRGCTSDGDFYAGELAFQKGKEILSRKPELILPVPLHAAKRRFRGFNQAAYIAKRLGELLELPVLPEALVRIRRTKPQSGLAHKQRFANQKGAFAVNEKYRDVLSVCQRVLLIDDIYTTGATLEACAEVLKEVGIKKVYFACLCIGKDCE